MIYCVSTRRGAFGIGDYLERDGRTAASFVKLCSYEELFDAARLPLGAYVFLGLDEITRTESELVKRASAQLSLESPGLPLLNDPSAWVPRRSLLEIAFRSGVNTFRVHRATRLFAALRFPVFVRSDSRHSGSLSPLLFTRRDVARWIGSALAKGYLLRDLLVVEYCHTADAKGLFRKYSAMVIGSTIVPRSLTISRNWVTKVHGRLTDQPSADEELDYVTRNPHAEWLSRVAGMGGVEYGRIDYGLKDGQPQLWEINTNPTIAGNPSHPQSGAWPPEDLRRLAPARQRFSDLFIAALSALEDRALAALGARHGRSADIVELSIAERERRLLLHERQRRARLARGDTMAARVKHWLIRPMANDQ